MNCSSHVCIYQLGTFQYRWMQLFLFCTAHRCCNADLVGLCLHRRQDFFCCQVICDAINFTGLVEGEKLQSNIYGAPLCKAWYKLMLWQLCPSVRHSVRPSHSRCSTDIWQSCNRYTTQDIVTT